MLYVGALCWLCIAGVVLQVGAVSLALFLVAGVVSVEAPGWSRLADSAF